MVGPEHRGEETVVFLSGLRFVILKVVTVVLYLKEMAGR